MISAKTSLTIGTAVYEILKRQNEYLIVCAIFWELIENLGNQDWQFSDWISLKNTF